MNSIPLIFNEREINRTVLGGKRNSTQAKMDVSVILLNSGGSVLRIQNLENLQNCGFEKIISMEPNNENYNFEDFINKFPTAKFIVPQEEVSDGDLINIGMAETDSKYVLVLRDSVQVSSFILTSNNAQKLIDKDCFCYVPRMSIDDNKSLSTNFMPSVHKGVFKVDSTSLITDMLSTLYPLDFIGMYNRQKFIQLGGFDYTIKSPYWQNLDLAFRAWLWGEEIKITTGFQISYLSDAPVEDTTSNLSQFRFYLKNLAPVFKLDHGEIPSTAILRTLRRSPCGFIETLKQFDDAKEWVLKNQYRFKTDAAGLISNWGNLK